MYSKIINELCEEAQRLLDLSITNLNEAEKTPDVLLQEQLSERTQDFSLKGVKKQIETLNGERQKLINQEMVLAVVGTMKAGKSTTINAIVGTEVLPNRNRPMTALPTLIRHTQGQREPVLHFQHTAPINALMKTLKQVQKKQSLGYLEQCIEVDEDMQALLSQIENNLPFEKQYQGAERIFHCLKGLNDLVRLSAALDIPFPFNEYATIDRIPAINVEFAHLVEAEGGHGQLTLLDTPGPNEAGQQHLRPMLEDQLNKASAVLVVLDYSQLDSLSDEDVRKCVSTVGKNVPLYALVNQFDRRDRNSDGEEQVKNLVSNKLLKDVITKERVFPVSSLWGYLANRARHEISLRGQLPPLSIDPDNPTWVDDFATQALGPTGEPTELQDTAFALKTADKLWEKSLFSSPIENIIKTAYAKAALISLQAASSKLVDYANNAQGYFQTKTESFDKKIDELYETVSKLTTEIRLLEETKKQIQSTITNEINLANKKARDATNEMSRRTSDSINSYFKRGQLDEKTRNEIERRINKQKKPGTGGIIKNSSPGTMHPDFDPNEDQIKFDNSVKANEFISNISNIVGDILNSEKTQVVSELGNLLTALESRLTNTITNSIEPIKKKVQSELKEAGFTVSLNFPTLNSQRLNFSAYSVFSHIVEKKQESVTRHRRASGAWGTVCGWFNTDDWGWEEYRENVERYVITLSKLKSNMQKQIATLSLSLESAISEQITNPVNKVMNDFFTEFSDKLESVRSNLQQSAQLQQQKQDSLEEIKKQAGLYSSAYKKILVDSKELKKDVDQLGV